MKKIILFLFLVCPLLAQDTPKLTQDRLFQIIGQKDVQIQLQGEYIESLLTKIKALEEELKKLKEVK